MGAFNSSKNQFTPGKLVKNYRNASSKPFYGEAENSHKMQRIGYSYGLKYQGIYQDFQLRYMQRYLWCTQMVKW
jgi:hypothetical protein